MNRLASIDIGSNAMRLEIFEIKDDLLFDNEASFAEIQAGIKKLKNPGRIRIPVRLGFESFPTVSI